MILKRVYNSALSRLTGKRIREARIGLELMVVELDDGSIGVTYVLKNETGHVCESFPQAGSLVGMLAADVAGWALQSNNVIAAAMGLAVLNSVAEFDKLAQDINPRGADAALAVAIQPADTVGIVGHIGPLITSLQDKVRRLFVFERNGAVASRVYPESAQPELLPQCQVVFISSTALINRTLENLLPYCANARDVVMVGASTPLYPEAFRGTGVTVLSGTRWLPADRDAVFTGVSQGGCLRQIIKYGQKISVKVER